MIAWILVTTSFIAAQMLSDIASLQIVRFAGLSLDAGTFIYPFTFTLRDVAHKVLGLKGVRTLIFAAAGINLFMSGFFAFVAALEPDPLAGATRAWGQVLAPVWRITMASIIAEVIAGLTDTESYRIWVERITRRYQWMRVLVSNTISIPLDSFVFVGLAFYGIMPNEALFAIFWANVLIKGLVTLFSLPLIYTVKDRHNA
ncbi:MAG: queuosine precursor transporter [Anaerolineaceae bacterium]